MTTPNVPRTTNKRTGRLAVLGLGVLIGVQFLAAQGATTRPAAAANPVLVFDTVKGSFEMELFRADAPKSVAHILELMQKNFYRAQRIHRVTESLVQFGDP